MPDRPTLAESSRLRILVVGGGAAGLSCAWRLLREGALVTVLDRGPLNASALWASGGMLAAGFEASVELDARHRLAQPFADATKLAADMWPDWIERLSPHAVRDIGYARRGVLTPLLTQEDIRRASSVLDQASRLGVEAVEVSAHDIRRWEPRLASTHGGVLFPEDGQLDNRALAGALIQAIERAGGKISYGVEVAEFYREHGAVAGVTLADGRRLDADLVVLATGARDIADAPPSVRMQPVKGQMLAFDLASDDAPDRVVRGFDLYLAAKPGGRLIVGATVEPGIDDLATDETALRRLAERAETYMPILASRSPVETWSGLRPASADQMPVIGWVESGMIVAGGGYRNGVLLAPLFAEAVCALAFNGPPPDTVSSFTPQRVDL